MVVTSVLPHLGDAAVQEALSAVPQAEASETIATAALQQNSGPTG